MQTKTIITIGPASESREMLSELFDAGMDIARFNFSHAYPDEIRARTENIRSLNKEKNREVAILQDLCGPRLRIGEVEKGGRQLEIGDTITFYTTGAKAVKEGEIAIQDPYLHQDIKVGNHILIEGGRFDCKVQAVDVATQRIVTEVKRGGTLFSNKGINLPYVKLTTSSPTEKDKHDIALAREYNFEYVALSFVQTADTIRELRDLLLPGQKIYAKIEDPIGVANIDEIIAECDGILIGRGDLGVELPAEEVPFIQKMIIEKCNAAGKPSIVATQALMSMVFSPFPTRAEVSDVANSVLDGATALMLSDETTVGKHPIEAVKTLVRIAKRAEEYKARGN